MSLVSTCGCFSTYTRYSHASAILPLVLVKVLAVCLWLSLFLCWTYMQATCGLRAKGRAVSATEFARWRTRSEELRRQRSGCARQAPAPRRCASAAPAPPRCWRGSVHGAPRVRRRGRRGRQGAPAPLLASPAWRSCPATCRRHAPHRQQHSMASKESRSV